MTRVRGRELVSALVPYRALPRLANFADDLVEDVRDLVALLLLLAERALEVFVGQARAGVDQVGRYRVF